MKKLTRFLCSSVLALVISSAVWAQSTTSPILDEMIQTLGGPAFLDVKEIHASGRFFSFSRGELSGSDLYVDYIKFPNMERTEFGRERSKSITINKGNEGWKIQPKKAPEPQSTGQVQDFVTNFKTSFDYVLRFVVKQPQTTIQNLPGEIIDFKRTDVVELRDGAKNLIRFYIDRETKLPVKMQVRRTNEPAIQEEQYGNWHKFQNVMTPLFVSRFTDGLKTMEIRTETVAYNSGLSDSLFAAPTSK